MVRHGVRHGSTWFDKELTNRLTNRLTNQLTNQLTNHSHQTAQAPEDLLEEFWFLLLISYFGIFTPNRSEEDQLGESYFQPPHLGTASRLKQIRGNTIGHQLTAVGQEVYIVIIDNQTIENELLDAGNKIIQVRNSEFLLNLMGITTPHGA